MKTIATSVLGILFLGSAFGQGYTESTANSQVKYYVTNDGTMFNNPSGPSGGYLVPKDSLVSAIYAMFPMMAGEDINGQLKGAAAEFQNSDFFRGPIADNYLTSEYLTRFGQSIWYMSKAEVDNHMDHYQDGAYTMSGAIENWPGNGNTTNGESLILAPFHDHDMDGQYEPMEGDYPEIRGDKALYVIVNDDANVHPSGLSPIQIEMHMMFYQFENATDPVLTNTTFVLTTLHNRGTQTLYNFNFGHLVDFDLGGYADDYIGTDIDRQLSYVYNADLNDGPHLGNPGYGENPPSVGVLALDGNMASNIRHMSDYSMGAEIYRSLQGLQNDGSPVLDPDGEATPYVYTETGAGWNESTAMSIPGDRRSVIGYDAFTLQPFTSYCFNNAIVYARSDAGSIFSSADSLGLAADHVQAFFDNQNWGCHTTDLGVNDQKALSISLYPNPTQDKLFIQGIESGTYRILNLEGRVVKSGRLEATNIDVETLTNGYYILEVGSNNGKPGRSSFVKE